MLRAQLMAAALGGGRATAAGVLEGEKGGDSHAKATGGVAGTGGRVCLWSRSLTAVGDADNKSKRMDKY